MRGICILILILSLVDHSFSNDLDIVSINLYMDVDLLRTNPTNNSMKAVAVIKFCRPKQDQSKQISFLLNRLLVVDRLLLNGETISADQQLQSITGWESYQVNHISFDPPKSPSDTLELTIEYHGKIASYAETGMLYVKETLDKDFFIIRPETMSFPQLSEPSNEQLMKRWRSGDTFDFRIELKIPSGYSCGSGLNQILSDTSLVLSSERPISFVGIPIAKYQEIKTELCTVYYFPEDSTGAIDIVSKIEEVHQLFTKWFGEAGDQNHFALAEIPEGFGSQVALPTIIQTADAFRSKSGVGQLYHEISHFWNIPDTAKTFPNRWNEGLAMFLQYLAMDELSSTNRLDTVSNIFFNRIKKGFSNGSYPEIPMAEYGVNNRTDLSYSVGMVFFNLIYKLKGKEFLKSYGEYYHTYKDLGTASDADFVKFMSDKLVLEDLINEWFYSIEYIEKISSHNNFESLVVSYK